MQISVNPRRIWLLLLIFATVRSASGQGTALSYQGRLSQDGALVEGNYDLTFAIFEGAGAGNQIGPMLVRNPVAVTNGLFTVTLDFGSAVFTGPARWLQIAVRTSGSTNAYSTLSPRQPVTPTPYSILAGNLSGTVPSGGLAGTYSSAVTFNNSSNIFSGNGAGLTGITVAPNGPAGGDLSGAYPNPTIGSNSITTAKLANLAVTTAKLADTAITAAKLGTQAVQTVNIADGAVGPTQLSSAALGSIQQVIRGVITFTSTGADVTASFSPLIDPTKSYVILSPPVRSPGSGSSSDRSALIALTASNLTVAIDNAGVSLSPHRVSYQIIQSK